MLKVRDELSAAVCDRRIFRISAVIDRGYSGNCNLTNLQVSGLIMKIVLTFIGLTGAAILAFSAISQASEFHNESYRGASSWRTGRIEKCEEGLAFRSRSLTKF